MTGLKRLATNTPMYRAARDPGASTPYGTFTPQRTAVPVEGSHAHQGGDLPAAQGAQLRQVRQKGKGELLSHAGAVRRRSSFSHQT